MSFKRHEVPWLVWLSGLSMGLRTKGLPVRFPVRAHTWVAGQVPRRGHTGGNHTLMFLSLSFPPFPSLKINKILKKKFNKMNNHVVWEDVPGMQSEAGS